MIKLVAFDWNGTLLSDASAVVKAEQVALAPAGFGHFSLKLLREHFRVPISAYWKSLGVPDDDIAKNGHEYNRVFHENYERLVVKCRTRKGAREILTWLKQQGISSVIISNHTVSGIEEQLSRLGIRGLIADVVANGHTHVAVNERNKLLKLKNYIEPKGIKGSEVLIIGDSCEETEVGKTLGCITVAIKNGYYSTKRLRAANPDYLISSLLELKDLISFQ
jgi:phosphoglycolate phosphatase